MALQEWPAVVASLVAGDCIALLRKGGIHEPGGAFAVEAPRCALLPSRAHQGPARLRADLPPQVLQADAGPEDQVVCRHWAELVHELWLDDLATAQAVAAESPLHGDEIGRRFAQGDRPGLHLLLVRVHALPAACCEPRGPQHGGCRSWVPLAAPLATTGSTPILPPATWQRRAERLLAAVGGGGG